MKVLRSSSCLNATKGRRNGVKRVASFIASVVLLSLAPGCTCDNGNNASFSAPKEKAVSVKTAIVQEPKKEVATPPPKIKSLTISRILRIKEAVVKALRGKGRRKFSKYNREDGLTSMQNVMNVALDCNRTYNQAAKWATKTLGIDWTGKGSKEERFAEITIDSIDTGSMTVETQEAWLVVNETLVKK